jgi:hypothetical protein
MLFILLSSTASALAVFIVQIVIVCGGEIGWTKFRYRKCHISEYGAGVIILRGDTYLVGNTVFGGMDQVLSRANKSYD